MIPPKSASRLRFSTQNRRETHHANLERQKRIWFADQPPAESVRDLLSNIDGGSVCQYLVVESWNLIALRIDGVDGRADVWGCHLGRDNCNPAVTYIVSRAELAGTVRNLFRFGSKCRVRLPVGYYRFASPAAVEAMVAAEALSGESDR